MHSMRSFDNNKPNISSSDRIKNLKSKTIYEAAKKRFQSKGECGSNKNVKYYSDGKVKSVKSYETQSYLAKGSTLCQDCNQEGMLCRPVASANTLAKITMGNSIVSEFWGGGELTWDFPNNTLSQEAAFPVIESDVSGTWDPSANDYKGDISQCGPGGDIVCPYGYATNVIKVPRNLDGDGIVVDPSNMLFSDDQCDKFRFLRSGRLKTTLVIRGLLWGWFSPGGAWFKDTSCNEARATLKGTLGTLASIRAFTNGFTGSIVEICCFPINIPSNPRRPGEGGVFEVHLELLGGDGIGAANPTYGGGTAVVEVPAEAVSGNYENGFVWDNATPFPEVFAQEDWAFYIWGQSNVSNLASMYSVTSESIKVVQGDCTVGINLSTKNKTKQSYMYCLEDGTTKINFS